MTSVARRVRFRRVGLALVLAVSSVSGASAQTTGNEWTEGTMLSGFFGMARDAGTGPAAAVAIGWELVPHLAIEGRGLWLFPGDDASAFAGLLGAKVPLLPGRRTVPFVSVAAGLHRAVFEPGRADVPDFYRARLGAGARTNSRTFDDFVSAVGAGFDVYVSTHLAVRPEIQALFVKGPGATHTVPVLGVHLAYHFENHEITP